MSASSSESSSSSSSSSVIPWGQREKELMFEVLDNPSLREEILKHVIIGEDTKADQRSACTLRRVDKSWNESVLRILWKAHEPLYRLFAGAGGDLDAFTKTFAVSSTISAPPPLNVETYPRLNHASDVEILSNFLTSCGPALLHLTITINDFEETLPPELPAWSLQRLHKLDINVFRRRELVAAVEQPDAQVAARHEMILESLIKAVLLGATALDQLHLSVDEWSSGDPVDVAIYDAFPFITTPITFPPSLVKIKLEIELTVQQSKDFVNALLESPLPNVTSLSLIVCTVVFADGVLFRMMDKWKTGLKNLVIRGTSYEWIPRNVNIIRFPVMKQLEEFSWSSASAELKSGLRSLETCFPKLHTLRLRRQTLGMLRKWTSSSRFSGVTCLELNLGFNQQGGKAMRLLNSAFPNLRKLELGICRRDPSGLWYVFQEMRELMELKLHVNPYLSPRGTTGTDVWDSILTGVPPERLASIRGRGPDSQETETGFVPITNLHELKSLSVKYAGGSVPRSVISDFIFHHAFLRMPQLTHLHFEGPFKVSATMTAKWMSEEGRRLVYQPK